MTKLVVDASVAVKWYLDEDYSAEARSLLGTRPAEFHVPDFIYAEIASVFWKRLRRGEMQAGDASLAYSLVASLPMVTHDSKSLAGAALRWGAGGGIAVYDRLYLSLARAQGCRMVTADRPFFLKASAEGHRNFLLWVGDAARWGVH